MKRFFALKYMAVAVLFAVIGGGAWGATYSWTGGGDGTTWTDPLNWNVGTNYPGYNSNAGNDVANFFASGFDASSGITVNLPSTITITSLQIPNPNYQTLSFVLTFTGSALTVPTIDLFRPSSDTGGSATSTTVFNNNLICSGTMTIHSGANVTFGVSTSSSVANITNTGGATPSSSINANGTLTSSGTITVTNGRVLYVNSGGTLTANAVTTSGTGSVVNNGGTISIATPSGPISYTWIGSSGGDWNLAANWISPLGANAIPGTTDTAIFNSTTNVNIDASSSVGNLSITSGKTVTLTGTNTLTIGADASAIGASIDGTIITGPASLNVKTLTVTNAGSVSSGTGTITATTLDNTGTFSVGGATVSVTTLTNNGTVEINGAGSINKSDSAKGTFDFSYASGGTIPALDNYYNLTVSGSGTWTSAALTINNTLTVSGTANASFNSGADATTSAKYASFTTTGSINLGDGAGDQFSVTTGALTIPATLTGASIAGTITAGGGISLNKNISLNADTTFASASSLGASVTVTTNAHGLSLNENLTCTTNDFVTSGTGIVTVATTKSISATTGNLAFAGNLNLAGNVSTSGAGTVEVGGNLLIAEAASPSISSSSGHILITGTTDGTAGGVAESLTVSSGDYITFSGAVGSGASNRLTSLTVTNSAALSFSSTVNLAGALAQTNAATGLTTFGNTVSVGSATLKGANYTVSNSFASVGAIGVTNSGSFSVGASGSISITGLNNAFTTTGAATLAGGITTNAGNVGIGGALTIADGASPTITNGGTGKAGTISVTGATHGTAGSGNDSLTITGGTGTITLGSVTNTSEALYDLTLSGDASITLPATTIVHDLTVTVGGTAQTIGQSAAITVPGTLMLSATGAITLNNASNQIGTIGTVSRGGNLTLYDSTSGLTVTGPITTGTTANNVSITTVGGTLSVNGNISATGTGTTSLTGDGVAVAGSVTVTGESGVSIAAGTGTFTTNASTAINASGTPINISADDIALDSGSTINAGTSTVTLYPATATQQIDLGTNTGGKLGLTAAELDTITATSLIIGRAAQTGAISVTAAIAPANAPNLKIINYTGGIAVAANITTTGTLTLSADADGAQTTGAITRTAGALSTTGTTKDLLLRAATGIGSIGSANPLVIGSVTGIVSAANSTSGDLYLKTNQLSDLTLGSTNPSISQYSGGALRVDASGNIIVGGTISTGASGSVVLNATGTITRSGAYTITGATVGLGTSGTTTKIGASGTSMLTAATTLLDARATTGGVYLSNTGNVNVTTQATTTGDIDIQNTGTTNTATGGIVCTGASNTVAIQSSGLLTVAHNVTGPAGVSLTGTGASGYDQTAGTVSATANPITIIADAMALSGTAAINATSGNVNIYPYTATTAITLGSGASGLGLSDAEIDLITTSGTLTFGRATQSGSITVDGTATITNASGPVTLQNTSGGIAVSNALSTTGTLTLSTAGSVSGTGLITVNAGSGTLDVSALTGINLNNATGSSVASASLTNGPAATSGNIVFNNNHALSLAASNTFSTGSITIVNNTGTTTTSSVSSSTGAITIASNDMDLASGTIGAGTSTVTLYPATATQQIDLGTNTGGKLGLTAAELDTITATSLIIGRAAQTGAISVTAAIAPANAPNLKIINYTGGIAVAANITTSGTLTLSADADGAQITGAITRTAGALSTTGTTKDLLLRAATGIGSIGSANPLVIGSVTGIVSAANSTSGDLYLKTNQLSDLTLGSTNPSISQYSGGALRVDASGNIIVGGTISTGASGSVVLNATGTITRSGAYTITGATVGLGTSGTTTKIGASGTSMLTAATTLLDARATTGGVYLSNTGNVNVTTQATTTGDIDIQNTGTTSTATGGIVCTGASNTVAIQSSGLLTVAHNVTGPAGVSLTGTGASGYDQTAGTVSATANPITIIADAMALSGTAAINATSGNVNIYPYTATTAITLGSGASGLGLSDAEIDLITTSGTLTFGRATQSGSITVDGTATITNASGPVTLQNTSGGIAVSNALSTTGTLTLSTAGSVSGTGLITVNAGSGTLDVSALTGINLNNATGSSVASASLTNGPAATSGNIVFNNNHALSLAASNTFSTGSITIVNNTGTTTIGAAGIKGTGVSNISLSSAGAVTQTGPIQGSGLELLGNGPYTLTNATNSVTTIAGSFTGNAAYADSDSLTVGTVNGTTGFTSTQGGNILLAAGTTTAHSLTISNTISSSYTSGTGNIDLYAGGTIAQNANITASVTGGSNAVMVYAAHDYLGAADTLTGTITGSANTISGKDLTLKSATGIGVISGMRITTSISNAITAETLKAGNIAINDTRLAGTTFSSVKTNNGSIELIAAGACTATSIISTTDSAANDISVLTTAGDLTVGIIDAKTLGGVSLTANTATGQSILDGNGATNNITCADLSLSVAGSIGLSTDALDTTATSLSVTSTDTTGTNNVYILEADALTISSIAHGNSAGTVSIATTDGSLTMSGSVTKSGPGSLIVTAGGTARDLTISSTSTVNAGSGNVTLDATNKIYTGTVAATEILTAGGTIEFKAPVILTNSTALSTANAGSGTGAILFDSTLDGTYSLDLSADSGAATFTGSIGGTSIPTALAINSGGAITFNDNVKLDGDLTLYADDLTVGSGKTINMKPASTAHNVSLYTRNGAGTIDIGFTTGSGTFKISDAEWQSIRNAAAITVGKAATQTGDITVQTAKVDGSCSGVSETFNTTGTMTLDDDSAGTADTALATGGSGTITINAGILTAAHTTSSTVSELATTGQITITATGAVGTSGSPIQFPSNQDKIVISAGGGVYLDGLGNLTLGTSTVDAINTTGLVSVTTQGTGNLTLANTIVTTTASGNITLSPMGSVYFNNTDSTDLIGTLISQTAADLSITRPIFVSTTTTITQSSGSGLNTLTFGSSATINSYPSTTNSLTVNAAASNVSFGAAIGGTDALSALSVTSTSSGAAPIAMGATAAAATWTVAGTLTINGNLTATVDSTFYSNDISLGSGIWNLGAKTLYFYTQAPTTAMNVGFSTGSATDWDLDDTELARLNSNASTIGAIVFGKTGSQKGAITFQTADFSGTNTIATPPTPGVTVSAYSDAAGGTIVLDTAANAGAALASGTKNISLNAYTSITAAQIPATTTTFNDLVTTGIITLATNAGASTGIGSGPRALSPYAGYYPIVIQSGHTGVNVSGNNSSGVWLMGNGAQIILATQTSTGPVSTDLYNGTGIIYLTEDVTSTGDVSYYGTVQLHPLTTSVPNTITITTNGHNVSFSSTVDEYSGTAAGTDSLAVVAGAGNVTFTGAIGGSRTINSLAVTSGKDVTIGAEAASGGITVSNAVSIAHTGLLTIHDLTSATDTTTFDIIAPTGFTESGAGGTVDLSGDIETTNAAISFANAVREIGNVALDTGSGIGNITFSKGVSRDLTARTLDLTAGTGNIIVPAAQTLGVSGTELGAITINSAANVAGDATATAKLAAIYASTLTQFAGTGTTRTGIISTSGNISLTGAAFNFDLAGESAGVNAGGGVSISHTGTLTIGDRTNATDTGTFDVVATSFSETGSGSVSIQGDIQANSAAGTIGFANPITLTGDVKLDTSAGTGGISFADAATINDDAIGGGTRNLIVASAGGNISFGATTAAASGRIGGIQPLKSISISNSGASVARLYGNVALSQTAGSDAFYFSGSNLTLDNALSASDGNVTIANSNVFLQGQGGSIAANALSGVFAQTGTGFNQLSADITAKNIGFNSRTYLYTAGAETYMSLDCGTNTVMFTGDLHIAATGSKVIRLRSPLKANNLILYAGTISFYVANATGIETVQDLVLLKGATPAIYTDSTSLVSTLYQYNNASRAAFGTAANTTILSTFPNLAAAAAPGFPDGATNQFTGAIDLTTLAGRTLKAGKNFYANGVNLNPASAWTLSIPDNNDPTNAFAEVYNLAVDYCTVVDNSASPAFAWVSASTLQGCSDGTHNAISASPSTGWHFANPLMVADAPAQASGATGSGTYTMYDDVVRVEFDTPIENTNNEIHKAVIAGAVTFTRQVSPGVFSQTAFTEAYQDPECTNPTSATTADLSVFYLRTNPATPAQRWNTDATGISAGGSASTDRGRMADGTYAAAAPSTRTTIPSIEIPRATLYVTLRDMYKNRIQGYVGGAATADPYNTAAGARFTATGDRCRPVLISVTAAQAKHIANPKASAANYYEWDGHNYLELVWSEPVAIGSLTTADRNVRSTYHFDATTPIGGDTRTDTSDFFVSGFFDVPSTQNFMISRGARDGVIGGVSTIADANDRQTANALYRHFAPTTSDPAAIPSLVPEADQPYRLRIYIAGYAVPLPANTFSWKWFWPGYLDGIVSDLGTMTPASPGGKAVQPLVNTYIRDLSLTHTNPVEAYASASIPAEDIASVKILANAYGTGTYNKPDIAISESATQPWDNTPPAFAKYRTYDGTSAGWLSSDSVYEIVPADTEGNGFIDRFEFHIFDDKPNYTASNVYGWASRQGWYQNNPAAWTTKVGNFPDTAGRNNLAGFVADTSIRGGIRAGTMIASCTAGGAITMAYGAFSVGTSGSVTNAYNKTGDTTFGTAVTSPLFNPSGAVNIVEDPYFCLFTDNASLRVTDQMYLTYDASGPNGASDTDPGTAYITDLAGFRLKPVATPLTCINKTPPKIALSIQPLGDKSLYLMFSKRVNLSNLNTELLINGSSTIIDSSTAAKSTQSASDTADGCSKDAILTLLRTLTLSELTSIKITPKTYPGTDPETGVPTDDSNITDSTGNYMAGTESHRVTDIGINVATPVYGSDGVNTDGTFGANEGALRVFDGTGRLLDRDITLSTQIHSGETPLAATPDSLQLYFDVNPPASVMPKEYNDWMGTDLKLWLPSILPAFNNAADLAARKLSPRTTSSSSASTNLQDTRNFILPSNDDEVKPGAQVEFLLKYGDLFCARLKDPTDITSVDPWRFNISELKLQRGGVTILNNVIDSNKRENTLLKVEMSKSGTLVIQIFTMDGNVVRTLERGKKGAGSYTYSWNGTNLAGNPVARGIYFIRVIGPNMDEIRKVMVVKE